MGNAEGATQISRQTKRRTHATTKTTTNIHVYANSRVALRCCFTVLLRGFFFCLFVCSCSALSLGHFLWSSSVGICVDRHQRSEPPAMRTLIINHFFFHAYGNLGARGTVFVDTNGLLLIGKVISKVQISKFKISYHILKLVS